MSNAEFPLNDTICEITIPLFGLNETGSLPRLSVHAKPDARLHLKPCKPVSAIFISSNYIPLGKASQLNK